MDKLNEFEQFAIELATKSGETILSACSKDLSLVESKENWRDLVTEYDRAIEKYIFDSLRSKYPDHVFIGEETTAALSCSKRIESDAPTWIVDPIDGTINFVHRYPMCCVSIGLAINKKLVLGVINAPFLGKLYSAVKGQGAKCNGKRIQVSGSVEKIEDSLVLNEFIVNKRVLHQAEPYLKNVFDKILWKAQGVRFIGSACIALGLLSEGVGHIYWCTHLCIWDVAAGAVILTEAGGTVLTINGDFFDPHHGTIVAAANRGLAEQVAKITSF